MSLTTILSEIWRFFKDKFLTILVSSVVFSIVFVVAIQFILPNIQTSEPTETEEEEQELALSNEQLAESTEYLSEVYTVKPAEFGIFVQLEDGSVFGNSFIYDEYFTTPEVVEAVEDETAIDFSDTLEQEGLLGITKDSQYRGSIAGIRNTSTDIITIRVQVGQTAEENLAIAEAYYDMVVNNEIPFADTLTTTIMNEPESGEFLDEEDQLMVSSPDALSGINPVVVETGPSIRQIVLYSIIGLLLGIVFMTAVFFIIQLFKKKISYAFQYSWDFDDEHFVINENKESLDQWINYPALTSRVVVSQKGDNLANLKDTPEEIVILVETGATDKDWFSEQYRLAEIHGSQIKIIQVIK